MSSAAETARAALDAHVREIVNWHFDPATGSPFWLDYANKLGWDPRKEIGGFGDLSRFPAFEDEWLRGGPVQRWIPKGFAGKPTYVFETGGTTGIPKTRVAFDDFRTDYELFSATLPDEYFPKGANWLMLGPLGSAPASTGGRASRAIPRRHLVLRRSRSAMGHQAHQERLDGSPRGLQGPRHRPGGVDSPGRPRHPLHVHDAEAARVAGAAARVDGIVDSQGRHHRHFFRRHGVHAAVEPVCARGAARRRLHDADLRQHPDGAGGERPNRARKQL